MTRARDLSKLSGPSVFTIDASSNVGVGTTVPDAKLDVIGVVTLVFGFAKLTFS